MLGFLALGAWECYVIWVGFAGGTLWPLGLRLPGGFWSGLLVLLAALPVFWIVTWLGLLLAWRLCTRGG